MPQHATARYIDPDVPEGMAQDYQEACLILELSPRASAMLSRRVLADLLEEYAQLDDFLLGTRLQKFSKDERFPSAIRQNVGALNEIAKLAAHTKKDDQAEIIPVDRDEAEWCLDLVERLFEVFIVTPKRDEAMRKAIKKKQDSVVDSRKKEES